MEQSLRDKVIAEIGKYDKSTDPSCIIQGIFIDLWYNQNVEVSIQDVTEVYTELNAPVIEEQPIVE